MKNETKIKQIKIGSDTLRDNNCSCRDVRVFDKTFDIWTSKDVFGNSPLTFNEIKILEEVNKADSLEVTEDVETGEKLLVIETPTHKVVVVAREEKEVA